MPFKTREQYDAWNRKRAEDNLKAINELKSGPCKDCGQTFPPYVMEFDHVPGRGTKIRTIGELAGSRKVTAPTMVAEIAKCDIVCANCHKIRTWNRLQI